MKELIEIIPNEIDEETGMVTQTIAILSEETSTKIAEFERQLKEIKEKEEELKQAILSEMESKNIIKIDTPELIVTRVLPTTKEVLDSKALKEDLADIYDAYVRIAEVKGSLRIKLK